MENFENKIEKEKGANIELVVHIMRHGDRDPDGLLEKYGRERTKKVAESNASKYDSDLMIKAFGSPAGKQSNESGMQRSLETAHIYGEEIANRKDGAVYDTRARSLLNYEDWDVLIIDPEYDYDAVYKQAIDGYSAQHFHSKEYGQLSEDEQKAASFYASNEATNYYMTLDTPAAEKSRKEVAGTFSVLLKRYARMAQEKLKSNQKLLFPLGSHTGMIEPFLSESVIWKDKDENEKHGATLGEIGGIFKPSEGFDIVLKTDQDGKLERVQIRFDDQGRLGGEAYLDMQKVDEFAEFYRELHKKDEESEQK